MVAGSPGKSRTPEYIPPVSAEDINSYVFGSCDHLETLRNMKQWDKEKVEEWFQSFNLEPKEKELVKRLTIQHEESDYALVKTGSDLCKWSKPVSNQNRVHLKIGDECALNKTLVGNVSAELQGDEHDLTDDEADKLAIKILNLHFEALGSYPYLKPYCEELRKEAALHPSLTIPIYPHQEVEDLVKNA